MTWNLIIGGLTAHTSTDIFPYGYFVYIQMTLSENVYCVATAFTITEPENVVKTKDTGI